MADNIYLYVCPAVGFTYADTMAEMSNPASDVPAEQALAVAPSTRMDDQILPSSKSVPIGKSNYVLDVQKSQRNPIFLITDTMYFNLSTGLYSCQLDEQWFNLHKDILRDALDITLTNDNNSYVAPPLSDTVIEYVNTLRKNLTTASRGKKKTTHLLIPSVRFVRKEGRETFGMSIPDALLTDEIKGAPYYGEYQCTSMPTEASGHAESPSLDEELALNNSEMGSDNVVPKINTVDQDEGQARPNPSDHDEGHTRPNPGENLKLRSEDQVILKEPTSSTRTLYSLQNLEKELSFIDQFFVEKQQEEEPRKINVEAEVHSPLPTSTTTTSIITTTTYLPPQAQQSTADPILVKRISELEQHMANLLQNNLALEERLDKHGSRLYKLKNLNIPHQKRKRRDLPRTPSGSPPPQPPPPHPPAGPYGAPGTSRASRFSQFPLLPPPSTGTFGSAQQQGTEAPSSSKSTASTPQSMAWTTSNTRYESAGLFRTQELSPTNSLIQDDYIPDEQVQLFDNEDSENDHLLKAYSRKDWWKPLPKEERPATHKPAWTIPSSNTRDMTNFLNWYCRQVNKTELTQANLEGQAYEVVKAFYPYVIHLQFQMEECHKMLIDQVDWTNLKGDQVRVDGSSLALSISKMKAASYPDFGLELLVLEQMWIDDVCTYDISAKYGIYHWWFNRQKFYIDRHDSLSRRKEVRSHMRILSVVKIKAYSRYGYDYLSEIVLRRANLQEYTMAKKYFTNLYPSDFEDLNLLLLQVVFLVNNNERKIMRFNEIYKFSDGTLTWILEALAYRVKEFKIKLLNPGINTRLWTQKDVTRSKEFIAAIERRLKTRRIYRNLECFVGGRVCNIDYRLLQRTK
nr:hypothetical protein [Tanacetum cinerariifolium]